MSFDLGKTLGVTSAISAIGGLFGGKGEPQKQTASYGLAPYDPGLLNEYMRLMGWSPAEYEKQQELTTFGKLMQERGGTGFSGAGGLDWFGDKLYSTKDVERPGYQYQKFGDETYMRKEGTPYMPVAARDKMISERNAAIGKLGQALSRRQGGMNPGIRTELAKLRQQASIDERAAELGWQRQGLSDIGNLINRVVSTGGTISAAQPSFGTQIGSTMGTLADQLMWWEMLKNLGGLGSAAGKTVPADPALPTYA